MKSRQRPLINMPATHCTQALGPPDMGSKAIRQAASRQKVQKSMSTLDIKPQVRSWSRFHVISPWFGMFWYVLVGKGRFAEPKHVQGMVFNHFNLVSGATPAEIQL